MCITRKLMEELWRPCTRHLGYEVSWDGRVRNVKTQRELRPQQAKSGRYFKVNLGRSLQVQLHQLVAEAWHGPRPSTRHVVDHIDNVSDQLGRNCASNLRWLTYSMNTRQWYAMNARLQQHGIEHGYHLEPELSDDEVDELLTASGF